MGFLKSIPTFSPLPLIFFSDGIDYKLNARYCRTPLCLGQTSSGAQSSFVSRNNVWSWCQKNPTTPCRQHLHFRFVIPWVNLYCGLRTVIDCIGMLAVHAKSTYPYLTCVNNYSYRIIELEGATQTM
ncbi:UNVERIFIED_CONTAM: hypothetical protein K2H54_014566 [Gekko kuhli]